MKDTIWVLFKKKKYLVTNIDLDAFFRFCCCFDGESNLICENLVSNEFLEKNDQTRS